MTAHRAFDSMAVLRNIVEQYPEIPVEWAETAAKEAEAQVGAVCQLDVLPEMCACGLELIGEDEQERGTCAYCEREDREQAVRDARDEYEYRRDDQ